jgi:hypothetical protein
MARGGKSNGNFVKGKATLKVIRRDPELEQVLFREGAVPTTEAPGVVVATLEVVDVVEEAATSMG